MAVVYLLLSALSVFILARAADPVVILDTATFLGNNNRRTLQWFGIPYALPPVGDLRFRLPQPIPPYTGSQLAQNFKNACPQQAIRVPVITGLAQEAVDFVVNLYESLTTPQSEDCLYLNVFKPLPTGLTPIPVVVWFPGGAFETGNAAQTIFDQYTRDAENIGHQIIFVTVNYRLSGFGFLGGKEVKDAGVGNLGLQDQRQALRWVRKYIDAFGGDPNKVTIWGEGAGAISASLQMVANNGNHEGLFRAAIMQSGAPIPVGDISNGQVYYDQIVADAGCTASSDTLACLRSVPYLTLKAAIDKTPSLFTYQSLRLAWLPRTDGNFLTDNPQRLVQQGKIAPVPFISGDCDDGGTIFSLSTLNVTTDAQFRAYIQQNYFPGIASDQLDQLATLYPGDIQQGSPFGTGILNAITPEFKRLAAIQGDLAFQAPRRWLLQQASGKQPIWTYLSKRAKLFPILGSAYSSDRPTAMNAADLEGYMFRFAATLDPNDNSLLGIFSYKWPKYTSTTPSQMTLNDGLLPLTTGQDNYRAEAMNFLTSLSLTNPI